MPFKERPEHELDQLPDEELIAYLVAAREAGRLDEARTALGIFAFGRYDDLVRRALAKVESRDDAEELAMQTIKGVLKSAFAGVSPGEAVNLMKTILARRIADFYDDRERKPPPERAARGPRRGGAQGARRRGQPRRQGRGLGPGRDRPSVREAAAPPPAGGRPQGVRGVLVEGDRGEGERGVPEPRYSDDGRKR